MPYIGFDKPKQESTEEEIEKREKEINEQQKTVQREEISLSKRKLESLREIYSEVVVHDYGDDYHKSEEELREQNIFYEKFGMLNGRKRNFAKLTEYINATRQSVEFVQAVADRQTFYPKEEFLRLWSKDKIKINGFQMPRYTGKDKKRISRQALAEFILSGEPAEEFLKPVETTIIDSVETLEQQKRRLFTREEFDDIMSTMQFEETLEDTTIIDSAREETYANLPVATYISQKDYKHLSEDNPGFALTVKDTIRDNRGQSSYRNEVYYDMEEDDLEVLSKYEKAYRYKSSSDIPVFKGSLMNTGDYQKYMRKLDNWMMENTRVTVNGKSYTRDEANQIHIKELLESNGWNILKLWNSKEKEKKMKKYIKGMRRREEQLRAELSRAEEARTAYENGKGKRTMKDASLVKSKKKKKKDKRLKKAVDRKQKRIDEMLLSTANSRDRDFDEYKGAALDWTISKMDE